MINLKNVFAVLMSLNIIAAILLSVSVFNLDDANNKLNLAFEKQYTSYLLADELRQSSDDLTKLARTYVVTGDESYKRLYNDILAIRDGKKPRPEAYHRVYWDFVAAGEVTPRPEAEAISLTELMVAAGFTEEEFRLLEKAKANSDGLVALEVKAMNLVDTATSGGSTDAAADLREARELLHSATYHAYKAEIMKPVDEFFIRLENRTGAQVENARESTVFYQTMTNISVALLISTMIALGMFVLVRVLWGLNSLREAMVRIASGDLDTEIQTAARKDEVGEMGRRLEEFRRNAIEVKRLQAEQERSKLDADEQARSLRNRLADEFETSIGSVIGAIASAASQTQASAEALARTSSQTSEQSTNVASAAEEASTNVQTVASAAEELSSSISEINRQVVRCRDVTSVAVKDVDDTDGRVQQLTQSVNKIDEVLSLITAIADQTNLLALNATIEAARAGDAGRGFAVVASEVKELASQTAKATDEIGDQIREIQESTKGTVDSIQSIGRSVRNVLDIAAAIAAAVDEQGTSTSEIARNIEQAASGTIEVTSSISLVANAASQTGQSSNDLLGAARELSEQSAILSRNVGDFLAQVRA